METEAEHAQNISEKSNSETFFAGDFSTFSLQKITGMCVGACISFAKIQRFQNEIKNELTIDCLDQEEKSKTKTEKWLADACAFNKIDKSGTKSITTV